MVINHLPTGMILQVGAALATRKPPISNGGGFETARLNTFPAWDGLHMVVSPRVWNRKALKITQDKQIQEIKIENVTVFKKLSHSCSWFGKCPANLRLRQLKARESSKSRCLRFVSYLNWFATFRYLFPKKKSVKGNSLGTFSLHVLNENYCWWWCRNPAFATWIGRKTRCEEWLGGFLNKYGSPMQYGNPLSQQAKFCPLLRLRIKVHIFGYQALYAVIAGLCSKNSNQTTV